MLSFRDAHEVNSPILSFIRGHGTQTALPELSNILSKALENNELACAMFLGSSRGFHFIYHSDLSDNLFQYGFRGSILSSVNQHLSNRSEIVVLVSIRRNSQHVRSGVQPAFIIACIFFNIYVNDLSSFRTHSKVFQYADDVVLRSRNTNYEPAMEYL